jgi:hypothetical protein
MSELSELHRNVIGKMLLNIKNPRNIRALSQVLMRAGANQRIKENAAKRVVGIRVSELYRRRKAALLNWARKYSPAELQQLINANNQAYNRRINSIPNPPQTRTNLIKAVIAKYLLNQPLHWNNARNAVARIHQAAGHQGNNRMTNARLVNFLMSMPTERLHQFHNNLPFLA